MHTKFNKQPHIELISFFNNINPPASMHYYYSISVSKRRCEHSGVQTWWLQSVHWVSSTEGCNFNHNNRILVLVMVTITQTHTIVAYVVV